MSSDPSPDFSKSIHAETALPVEQSALGMSRVRILLGLPYSRFIPVRSATNLPLVDLAYGTTMGGVASGESEFEPASEWDEETSWAGMPLENLANLTQPEYSALRLESQDAPSAVEPIAKPQSVAREESQDAPSSVEPIAKPQSVAREEVTESSRLIAQNPLQETSIHIPGRIKPPPAESSLSAVVSILTPASVEGTRFDSVPDSVPENLTKVEGGDRSVVVPSLSLPYPTQTQPESKDLAQTARDNPSFHPIAQSKPIPHSPDVQKQIAPLVIPIPASQQQAQPGDMSGSRSPKLNPLVAKVAQLEQTIVELSAELAAQKKLQQQAARSQVQAAQLQHKLQTLEHQTLQQQTIVQRAGLTATKRPIESPAFWERSYVRGWYR